MVTKTEFQDLVANAYQYLYDFVHLRNHRLTQLLIVDDSINHKERGWQLHHLLLDVVEELYPGPAAPPFSREWRRHRLMVLRYVEVMDPQMVADQLAISRRQFYREHASALEAIANILWERRIPEVIEPYTAGIPANPHEAMQLELARISQDDAFADVGEVLEGVIVVLDRVLQQNNITIDMRLPVDTPIASIGHNLLRQVMMGILGYLARSVRQVTLIVSAVPGDTNVRLRIASAAPRFLQPEEAEARLETFQEMLSLSNATAALIEAGDQTLGFELDLPVEYDCTVLAVDDNEDTLALYKRCLAPNRYRVITTQTSHTVPALARDADPDVIILDLMMPDQDGWDLLQLLSNQPDTAHIPIMICSVLKQKQLALSLGAAAFLEKPFTEQTLLAVLDDLRSED